MPEVQIRRSGCWSRENRLSYAKHRAAAGSGTVSNLTVSTGFLQCDLDYSSAGWAQLMPFIAKRIQEGSMNKLFLAAETALAFVNAASASTAEANRFLLRRYLKCGYLRRAFRLDAEAAANDESQPIDEKTVIPGRQRSALCELFANHPHVFIASLFTRNHRQ
jgi:hypothetical protein